MTHDIDLAYLAGITDGEGTITIALRHNDTTFSPWFTIGNTNIEIIKAVKEIVSEIVGREIRWTQFNPQAAKWKVCYRIAVFRQDEIQKVIMALRPFLRGKAAQADIMLKYLALGKSVRGVVDERMDLKNQIQILNKRGPLQ